MQYLHYYFIAFQENMQFYWKNFKFSLQWLKQNFMIAYFDWWYFTRIIDFHNDGERESIFELCLQSGIVHLKDNADFLIW